MMSVKKFQHYSYFQKVQRFINHRLPFVCLGCQKAFRYKPTDEEKICPQCRGKLIKLSHKFNTPKQTDNNEWAKIRYLIAHGFRFDSLYVPVERGVFQRVSYPQTLDEAYDFVEKYKKYI